MSMLKFAAWLPVQARLEQAMEFARSVASRHDVPVRVQAYDEDGNPEVEDKVDNKTGEITATPVMVRAAGDLRDVKGRWWGTKDGKSIASVLLIDEPLQGSQSAIVPALMALVAVLTVMATSALTFSTVAGASGHDFLMKSAKGVALLAGAGVFVLFSALWTAIGAKGNRMVLAGAVLVPAFGMLLDRASGMTGAGSQLLMGGLSGSLIKVAIPVAVLAFVAFLFIGRRDATKQFFLGTFKAMVFFVITATIARILLPNWAQPLYWAFLGCAVPLWWNHKQELMRALALMYQGGRWMGDTRTLGNTSAEKRQRQAEQAEKDKSGFIPLGEARGVLTEYGDGFSPDAGLLLGLTCHELRTHFHGFGKTGGGKTFNLFAPIIQWWARHGHGGVLVLDGKGAAGDDLLGKFITKYGLGHRALLIKPGIRLGLMEGLTPNDFIDAIFDIGGARSEEQSQSDHEKFFITQARTFGLSISRILWAVVELQRGAQNRTFYLTIDGVDRMKVALKRTGPAGQQILQVVKELPVYKTDPLIQDAVRYIEHDFWTQPDEQAGGIISTFDNTIKDLLAHPELRAWASMETGVDITIPTTGGFVAVSLPEVKYGQAGKLVQSLIKQRLFVKIRRRGDYDWRAEGETPVLFAVDESQEMISKADRDFLPQARGLGGYAAYFTQSYDAYESRMGDAATRAFLDNFRSLAAFESSPKTYEFIGDGMGKGKFITWASPTSVIGYMGTAQIVASSPLHDDTRDDAKFMRKFRRRGAGRVILPLGRPDGSRTVPMAGGAQAYIHDTEARMLGRSYHDPADIDDDAARQFTFQAIVSSEVKERPLLMQADCAKHLNSEQDAILSVRRGGAQRHDFVRFETLTPEQIQENERHFHRALIFNGLVHTLQRDLVAALGKRPTAGQLRRLTQGLIHLVMFNEDFAERYKTGDLRVDEVQSYVDKNWTQDFTVRQAWRQRAQGEREAFIDLYLFAVEDERLAA
ncbi:MAG: TraM recognition domain-containing protein [Luteimonas sp.]